MSLGFTIFDIFYFGFSFFSFSFLFAAVIDLLLGLLAVKKLLGKRHQASFCADNVTSCLFHAKSCCLSDRESSGLLTM